MHDPMTVAFDVPAPIPRRQIRWNSDTRRWGFVVSRRTNEENLGERTFPWWRPRGYTLFAAGNRYGLRTLATVWHVEPDGRDSGDVCKHYRRNQRPDGTWETTVLHGWRWHVHHWRIQVPALQGLRRFLLTRCEWCNGPSRKRSRVNVSHSWGGERGPWWRGERGLFHAPCSSAHHAARSCTCADPILDHDGWGTCARCGLVYGYGRAAAVTARLRELKRCPPGRMPSAELMAVVKGMPSDP